MSTDENPYAIPDSRPRFDALTVYQESFFALIWPSVAWAVSIIVSTLTWELVKHLYFPGFSPTDYSASFLLGLCVLTIPMSAYFLTARRLKRGDGQHRSIQRSFMMAILLTFSMIVAGLVSIPFAGVFRDMIHANLLNRIAINMTVIPAACTAFLAFVFKSCCPEIYLTRFVSVSIASISIIVVGAFSHPRMPEITSPISLTFFAALMSVISHCSCFAWWYATPWITVEDATGPAASQQPITKV